MHIACSPGLSSRDPGNAALLPLVSRGVSARRTVGRRPVAGRGRACRRFRVRRFTLILVIILGVTRSRQPS